MLDEQILTSFKAQAARAGRSLSSLVEDAMRRYDRKESSARPERWPLMVLGGGHPLPDIDWTSNVAVEEFLSDPNDGRDAH